MAALRHIAISLAVLLPAAARPMPALHVDPSVDQCSVHFSPELTQGAFRRFVREFGSVSAFKQDSGPATLGKWGVAVDVSELAFDVDQGSAAWNDTFVHPKADHWLGARQAFPMLRLRVGVGEALDVGAFFTENFEANYGWVGVDAKYAVLAQGPDMPVTLAVRGAYTKTLFVRDVNLHAFGADVTVGRTFWRFLAPYAGVGADGVLARETSPNVTLKDEAPIVPHATAGVEVRYWHLAGGAEVQVGALTSYQLRVSAVF